MILIYWLRILLVKLLILSWFILFIDLFYFWSQATRFLRSLLLINSRQFQSLAWGGFKQLVHHLLIEIIFVFFLLHLRKKSNSSIEIACSTITDQATVCKIIWNFMLIYSSRDISICVSLVISCRCRSCCWCCKSWNCRVQWILMLKLPFIIQEFLFDDVLCIFWNVR